MKLENNRVILDKGELKTPKKITGTRLGAILGLNNYSTPFQVWCEMQKIWESPFEDSIYTLAGKAIEPKQAQYIKENYSKNIIYPKDLFGEDYFNKTHGNFFNDPYFGGMWDYLDQEDSKINCVFEMKTAGKSKMRDWAGGKVPDSYALQASLYAYLLGVDKVVMVATFLNQKNGDYEHPEDFIVANDNTQLTEFLVSEKFPTFQKDYIDKAIEWWNTYIETGISPEWDAIRDAEIINALMDNTITTIKDNSLIVNKYTASLDAIIKNIESDIELKSINTTAKNYYFKLPLEIYNISCNIKDLNDFDAKTEINNKLTAAKQKVALLENYI